VLADDLTGSALRIMNVHYVIDRGPFIIVAKVAIFIREEARFIKSEQV